MRTNQITQKVLISSLGLVFKHKICDTIKNSATCTFSKQSRFLLLYLDLFIIYIIIISITSEVTCGKTINLEIEI